MVSASAQDGGAVASQWFKGAFANQNIVCKLRDQATVDFLIA